MKIKILGSGSWGTALAYQLFKNGNEVGIWSIIPEQVEEFNKTGENKAFLPGVILPPQIKMSLSLDGIEDADWLIISVPSPAVREVAQKIKGKIRPDCVLVNTGKGFFPDNPPIRLSEVIKAELPEHKLVVLSGPSHAEEVGRDLPTAVAVAGCDEATLRRGQDLFMNDNLRVYLNDDIIGVEVGAAVKNVIALGNGIARGLGMGDNTQAALLTRGLAEMTRLGVAMGAKPATFAGLTGIGDLVVTCGSLHSRNLRAGIAIGQGQPWPEVVKNMGMVVEGVYATHNAKALSSLYNVEMPITDQIFEVLTNNKPPREAMYSLMRRDKTSEGL